MTATYTEVKEALSAVLAAIEPIAQSDGSTKTLTVYKMIPGQIITPAAVVAPGTGAFYTYRTSAVSHDLTLTVTLFVQRGQDRASDELLSMFIADSGDASIFAAVNANPTLNDVVDSTIVTQARDWGVWTFGDISYLGVVFDVEVLL